MTLTTIAFTSVVSFQFVGWHLNVFTVNSHRSLMCGHLVLPCGKSSPLQKKKPYSDMSDEQVIKAAIKGNNHKVLARPEMCPLEVYEIMLKCWVDNSEQRATFAQLFQLLISLHIDQ